MSTGDCLSGRRRWTTAFKFWWLLIGAAEAERLQRGIWSWFWRFVLLWLLWWVLTDADPQALGWGLPVVTLASLISTGLPHTGDWRWRPIGLLRFLPTFVWYNLQGGIGVALHALWPGRRPDPTLLTYRLRLPAGPSQIFFANLVNLVPGTLTTRIGRRSLDIHVLVASPKVAQTLARLEWRVADLFGVEPAVHD